MNKIFHKILLDTHTPLLQYLPPLHCSSVLHSEIWLDFIHTKCHRTKSRLAAIRNTDWWVIRYQVFEGNYHNTLRKTQNVIFSYRIPLHLPTLPRLSRLRKVPCRCLRKGRKLIEWTNRKENYQLLLWRTLNRTGAS